MNRGREGKGGGGTLAATPDKEIFIERFLQRVNRFFLVRSLSRVLFRKAPIATGSIQKHLIGSVSATRTVEAFFLLLSPPCVTFAQRDSPKHSIKNKNKLCSMTCGRALKKI